MANFYTEHPELRYHLNNPMMERICELKERNYRDKEEYDYAPQDYADAMDSYDKVLEITGEITGEVIAANAESVDLEGPHCADGRVEYASGTKVNMDAMVKAGLNGMTMPRRFGGLNFPITPYTMCAEIVAAADAGFSNIWSLQDCIETLYEFGNEDQHSRFIPRICAGETMSMDLTEPDAGSDLQSVMLKATFDEANNCWRLNGVKRFITTDGYIGILPHFVIYTGMCLQFSVKSVFTKTAYFLFDPGMKVPCRAFPFCIHGNIFYDFHALPFSHRHVRKL